MIIRSPCALALLILTLEDVKDAILPAFRHILM
jgi:hypothetical protein